MSVRNELPIVICGGGNAAHTLAAFASAKSRHPLSSDDVRVLDLYQDEAEKWGPTITCSCPDGTKLESNLTIVSKNVEEVIPRDKPCFVIFVVPGFAHEAYLRAIRPHLVDGSIIGAMPGEGAFDVSARYIFEYDTEYFKAGDKKRPLQYTLFVVSTLPWACRISSYGENVDLLATKTFVDVAVHPNSMKQVVEERLQKLLGDLPEVRTAPSLLAETLGSRFWHPVITYGYYRNRLPIAPMESAPLFYENIDKFTAEKISLVSDEELSIALKIGAAYPQVDLSSIMHVKDWMLSTYGPDISDKSSLQSMLNTNKGYLGLTHPVKKSEDGKFLPNFKYRYLSEDVPFGLVVMRGTAELAGVPTPNIDEVILWAQEILGKQYLSGVNGTVKGMRDINETRCPQRYGFNSLDDFMKANHYLDETA